MSGSKRHQTLFHIFFIYIIYRIRKLKEKTMHVHITTVCHILHAVLSLSALSHVIDHVRCLASAGSSVHIADVMPSTIVIVSDHDPCP